MDYFDYAPANSSPSESRSGTLVHDPGMPWHGWLTLPLFVAVFAAVGWFGCWLFAARSALGQETGIWQAVWGVFMVCSFLGIGYRAFWRIAFEIDAQRQSIVVSQGPVWPIFSERYACSKFTAVVVSAIVRKRNSGPAEATFLLELHGPQQSVRIARGASLKPLRNLADDVGRLLWLNVIDATRDPAVVQSPEMLGRTLQDASVAAKEPSAHRALDVPAPPGRMRISYELTPHRVAFHLPTAGYGCVAALLPFAAAGIALVAYVAIESRHPGVIAIWSAIVGFFLLAGFAIVKPSQTTIEADRRTIRVVTTSLGVAKCCEIPTHSVAKITRAYKSIQIESRERDVSFGSHALTEEQTEWMRAALMQAVVG